MEGYLFNDMERSRIVVALTGASGAGYGLELLKGLNGKDCLVTAIYNDTYIHILEDETGYGMGDLGTYSDELVHNSKMDHRLASGSNAFDALVICPCSTSTASKIATGIADNLTTRCAAVALKERRSLVIVVRETPLSSPVLRSLYDLSSWGAVIMPASPPFYGTRTDSILDIMRMFSGRIMDVLGIENDRSSRYAPEEEKGREG